MKRVSWTGLTGAGALAACLVSSDAMAENTDWTGPWVSAAIGYDRSELSADGWTEAYEHGFAAYANYSNDFSSSYNIESLTKSGPGFSLGAGYDWVLRDKLLIGIGIDVSLDGIESEFTTSGLLEETSSSWGYTVDSDGFPISFSEYDETEEEVDVDFLFKMGNSASLLLRFGRIFDNSTLLYGLAGLTRAEFEVSTDGFEDVVLGFEDYSVSYDSTGWTLGFGVERRLSETWSLKMEYRFSDFETLRVGDKVEPFSDSNSRMSNGNEHGGDLDPRLHSLTVGLAFRF